jgi:hypothetical protein
MGWLIAISSSVAVRSEVQWQRFPLFFTCILLSMQSHNESSASRICDNVKPYGQNKPSFGLIHTRGARALISLRGGELEEYELHPEIQPDSKNQPERAGFCKEESSLGLTGLEPHAQERFRSPRMGEIDLVGDGAVVKTIVRRGCGDDRPKDGDMVYIQYRAYISNGREFDDSRRRETAESRLGLPYGFTLGKCEVRFECLFETYCRLLFHQSSIHAWIHTR